MRSMLIVGTAASLLAASAFAQTPNTPTSPNTTAPAVTAPAPAGPAPAAQGPQNPAVKTTEGNNVNTPVEGANSFTEGQAKTRIESRGFANVSGLTKDTQGIWRGKAKKDGKDVTVSLDYQGNVVAN